MFEYLETEIGSEEGVGILVRVRFRLSFSYEFPYLLYYEYNVAYNVVLLKTEWNSHIRSNHRKGKGMYIAARYNNHCLLHNTKKHVA